MKMYLIIFFMLGFVEWKSVAMEPARTLTKRSAPCYGTLGCFSNGPPFTSPQRPVSLAPQSPDIIQTLYLLYTRESRTIPQVLDARYPENVTTVWTNFKDRPTIFLVQGFLDGPDLGTRWQVFVLELLTHDDYNVVMLDWTGGNYLPYTQATANTRVVGAQISKLIQALKASTNITEANFHLIGHSLGAQVCGYAGERLPGLGRITGLDPAGPYFEDTDKAVRLDETDATFVDILHTDADGILQLGLGTRTQSGHSDFYPNRGHDQPGCDASDEWDIIEGILNDSALQAIIENCNHRRAISLFIESINSPCPFLAFPCASEEDFANNLCHSFSNGGCARMGFHADDNKPPEGQRVKCFLTTGDSAPFCRYHYIITLKLTSGQGTTQVGTADIVISGDDSTSDKVSLTGKFNPQTFTPGQTYTFYVMLRSNTGNIQSVTFSWESTFISIVLSIGGQNPTLYLAEFSISREEAGVNVRLCAGNHGVPTGTSLTIATTC